MTTAAALLPAGLAQNHWVNALELLHRTLGWPTLSEHIVLSGSDLGIPTGSCHCTQTPQLPDAASRPQSSQAPHGTGDPGVPSHHRQQREPPAPRHGKQSLAFPVTMGDGEKPQSHAFADGSIAPSFCGWTPELPAATCGGGML